MAHRVFSLFLITALLSACSWERARRSGYETVESMRIQQCLDRRDDADCPTQRQRYEDYEAQRQGGAQE
jgi:hypothetical protein